MRKLLGVTVAAVVLALAGCGTVHDTTGHASNVTGNPVARENLGGIGGTGIR
jgi:hypothetical protein